MLEKIKEIGKNRDEYPRPDFQREKWKSLNGEWDFDFDDDNTGEEKKWYQSHNFTKRIKVPFCYQSELSGIADKEYHPYIWYRTEIKIDTAIKNKSILLKFGAVDYCAKIWVNGYFVGEHKGGHTSFEFDIANYVDKGTNNIILKAEDKNDCISPRGKQHWEKEPDRCWYTPTSGIWQSVWLEFTDKVHFKTLFIIPDIDKKCVKISTELSGDCLKTVNCKISFRQKVIAEASCVTDRPIADFLFPIAEQDFIEEIHYWSPDTPNLYDVELSLNGESGEADKLKSYFGMRKVSSENGKILLNNKPFYQKLILNQGYWRDGLMTAPSDKCFIEDLKAVKNMGFNGVRMHQKIEDPRFYYWADILGVLVWEEMPSAYVFCEREISSITHEWIEVLKRDMNHPCVITWVTLNESWGVRNIISSEQQQNFAAMLYYLTKSIDDTRLVSSNDGWEQIEASDICSIHDYITKPENISDKYADIDKLLMGEVQGRLLYAFGHKRKNQPVILSEFGGTATKSNIKNSWGYNEEKVDIPELLEKYMQMIKAIGSLKYLSGFCYTQLTDVMQEVNGLFDEDHKAKVDLKKIKEINEYIK